MTCHCGQTTRYLPLRRIGAGYCKRCVGQAHAQWMRTPKGLAVTENLNAARSD